MRIGGALATLLSSFTMAAATASEAPAASPLVVRWCGTFNEYDRACPLFGQVRLVDGAGERAVPVGTATRVSPGSTLSNEIGSQVRLSFARQAICELGPHATEILTRPGDLATSLFLQRQGRTRCKSSRGRRSWVALSCRTDGRCPAQADVRGKFVTYEDRGAHSASHEGDESRVVLLLCAGFYSVRVERDFGFAEVGGGSSSRGPVRISVVESGHEIHVKAERVLGRQCTGVARI
ncbi:MAG TPA: hypothetical protein VHF50_05530 [Solirubrobacterales bacterium]|nr:hypothetical protein [Solirubrobacterales bacterium]